MTYKMESIKKVVKLAKETEKKIIKTGKAPKICISKGNRKIGKVMNVSLMPVLTCHNCTECKKLCYDIKACLQYPNTVIDARMRNTVLATYYRDEYFRLIDEACSRRRLHKFFRWHVAGDMLDMDYFKRVLTVCRNHPDFKFWTYTKYYGLINEYCDKYGKESIPENFSIMFSEWDGMPMENPYNFPVFSCKLKDGNKNRTEESFSKMFKCPGNCDICKQGSGHGCIAKEDTYCIEH